MRWVFFGACVLLGCSGEAFSPADEKATDRGGEAGETSSGGTSGASTGGSPGGAGEATGGADAEGGEHSTGGSEMGGTGGSEPTGGTSTGGSAGCEDLSTFYRDVDGDGYGRDQETVEACEAPAGYADQGGDCADIRASDAIENPGAEELCNGADDNCNEEADEGDACPAGCLPDEGFAGQPPIQVTCAKPAAWGDAVEICEGLGVELTADYQVVIATAGIGTPWLGASDSSGAWTWLSGERVPSPTTAGHRWATGEPSSTGHCMKYTSGWASEDCSRALPFICAAP